MAKNLKILERCSCRWQLSLSSSCGKLEHWPAASLNGLRPFKLAFGQSKLASGQSQLSTGKSKLVADQSKLGCNQSKLDLTQLNFS